jgi:hypothetical protein
MGKEAPEASSSEGSQAQPVPLAYVVPIRGEEPIAGEFASYLQHTSSWVAELVVVDGSAPDVARANRRSLAGLHLIRPSRVTPNGKVGAVLTGLAACTEDAVVVADDDVRYRPSDLMEVARRLRTADAVVPQNVFRPMPWHARWDTARSLIHRALGMDMPGTIAVRRASLPGYDGAVLFENLELLRTVAAGGGRVAIARDLFVARRPPSTAHFWSQRVRQDYDEFARPGFLLTWLSILPIIAAAIARRKTATVSGVVVGSIAIAEFGRRREGGRAVFPPTASLWAPLWLGERAVCIWLAVAARLRGGARYRGARIRRASTSRRRLRRRVPVATGHRRAA